MDNILLPLLPVILLGRAKKRSLKNTFGICVGFSLSRMLLQKPCSHEEYGKKDQRLVAAKQQWKQFPLFLCFSSLLLLSLFAERISTKPFSHNCYRSDNSPTSLSKAAVCRINESLHYESHNKNVYVYWRGLFHGHSSTVSCRIHTGKEYYDVLQGSSPTATSKTHLQEPFIN